MRVGPCPLNLHSPNHGGSSAGTHGGAQPTQQRSQMPHPDTQWWKKPLNKLPKNKLAKLLPKNLKYSVPPCLQAQLGTWSLSESSELDTWLSNTQASSNSAMSNSSSSSRRPADIPQQAVQFLPQDMQLWQHLQAYVKPGVTATNASHAAINTHFSSSSTSNAPYNSADSCSSHVKTRDSSTTVTCDLVDWKLLQYLSNAGRWGSAGHLGFELGQAHALLPAKYSMEDQMLCQVAGQRRVLLVPPSAGLKGLYPYPVAHPYDGYSCVDLEDPEVEHWKEVNKVRLSS